MTEVRFQFGDNWLSYSKKVGDQEIDQAIIGLKKLLPDGFDPTGKSMIDIGCGSGIHSIAAAKFGFESIVCVDYDSNSVAATIANAKKFNVSEKITAFQDDILDTKVQDQFDVVYSWGVLHHTGNMWKAISVASSLLKDDGTFIIAIYLKTRFCGMWKKIKWFYCHSPKFIQYIMIYSFHVIRSFRQVINLKIFKVYNKNRGMDRFHDSIDWVGGYPYESASADEITKSLDDQFKCIKMFNINPSIGLLGSGCAEYVFRKKDAQN